MKERVGRPRAGAGRVGKLGSLEEWHALLFYRPYFHSPGVQYVADILIDRCCGRAEDRARSIRLNSRTLRNPPEFPLLFPVGH